MKNGGRGDFRVNNKTGNGVVRFQVVGEWWTAEVRDWTVVKVYGYHDQDPQSVIGKYAQKLVNKYYSTTAH